MGVLTRVWFSWLLFFCFVYQIVLNAGRTLEVGSCSQKCQTPSDNGTESSSNPDTSHSRRCSCTRSCRVYRDCCPDSEFRTPIRSATMSTICLPLSNKANYKAVAKCPFNWTKSTVFCVDSVGLLPPVTSKVSGITYTNVHCAICNDDAEQLVLWNVDLRCCEEHDNLEDQTWRRFIYRKGYLYSVIQRQYPSSQRRCICTYFAREEDNSFVDSLELRTCGPRPEISTCSSTWRSESTRDLCDSFIEPVYVGSKVYRNVHCAECNYENLELLHCKPSVIEQMIAEGLNDTEIFSYCEQNEFRDCLHYFTIGSKGRGYAFSRLLNIRSNECVPQGGNRCCEGERYDFKFRRCRKLEV